MQIYGHSHVHGTQGVQGPHLNRINAPSLATESSPAVGDQLDISPAAEAAIQAAESQNFRADLVARIRNEIAADTYDSTERLAASMDGLLDEVG
jgi:anti-sigma28 factor (negative regulator of flagellin synthesis)